MQQSTSMLQAVMIGDCLKNLMYRGHLQQGLGAGDLGTVLLSLTIYAVSCFENVSQPLLHLSSYCFAMSSGHSALKQETCLPNSRTSGILRCLPASLLPENANLFRFCYVGLHSPNRQPSLPSTLGWQHGILISLASLCCNAANLFARRQLMRPPLVRETSRFTWIVCLLARNVQAICLGS